MENTRHPERKPILFERRQDKIQKTKRDKILGTETCPVEGVVKEEKFPHSRKPSHRHVCGEIWNLRGQHDQEKKKTKNKKKTIEYALTASREVSQMLMSSTS